MAELIKKIKVGSTTYDIGVDINNLEGVRSITTGTANGTISVNTNGTVANIAVKGLQDGAYYPYNNFYNEYYGGTWHQLRMVNSSSDRGSIFYKIADLGRTSGYGTYEAIKITGYMYHHKGNWEQSQTAIIPFQAILNVSSDTATLYSTRQCSTDWLRLVKIDTRLYELQASCNMAHCDFDIFYQISNSGSNNCTIYEGQNLVPGTTTGTVLSITNSENWGNYAYKADQLATARTIRTNLASTSTASFDGSSNITPGVTGTLPIANGGTGATTAQAAAYSFLGALDTVTASPIDNTYYISQDINGGNTYHRRPASSMWNYIKGKTDATYLPLSGGTMTGTLNFANNVGISGLMAGGSDGWSLRGTGVDDAGVLALTITDNASTDYFDIIFDDWDMDPVTAIRFGGTKINSYVPFYGAVWNDYAEYRESDCTEYGRVLVENGDDTFSMSTERLQPFAGVSSDTWGFCQGETEKAKTPIAVAGRVLVYPYRDRNEYKPGDVVCAAPNGTVDIMTREEVINYPDRIVGTVSCVPNYEEWGSGDRKPAKVNGRIWIKV